MLSPDEVSAGGPALDRNDTESGRPEAGVPDALGAPLGHGLSGSEARWGLSTPSVCTACSRPRAGGYRCPSSSPVSIPQSGRTPRPARDILSAWLARRRIDGRGRRVPAPTTTCIVHVEIRRRGRCLEAVPCGGPRRRRLRLVEVRPGLLRKRHLHVEGVPPPDPRWGSTRSRRCRANALRPDLRWRTPAPPATRTTTTAPDRLDAGDGGDRPVPRGGGESKAPPVETARSASRFTPDAHWLVT